MPPVVTTKLNMGDPNMANVPKEKKTKRQNTYSNFLLTINTNQQVQPTSEEFEPFCRKFRGVIQALMTGATKYIKYKTTDGCSNLIDSINSESTVEVGTDTNPSVHCHSLIMIKHHTKLQLDLAKIRHVVKAAMDLPGVYVNVRLVNRNAACNLQAVLGYIRKDVSKDKPDIDPTLKDAEDVVAEYVQ